MSRVPYVQGPVIVRVIGGLGNQMFQYAAARALSVRFSVPVLLDFRAFESYLLRRPGLFRWRVEAAEATPRDLRRYPELVLRLASRSKVFAKAVRSYLEPSLRFDTDWGLVKAPVHLRGYFQCERYFLEIRDQLLQEFVPAKGLNARSAAIATRADGVNSVAIHVRRGDYVNDPRTAAVHGQCDLQYYRDAIDTIVQKTGPATFFVFSDDMEWTRSQLELPGPVVYVEGNLDSPEVDIHLMSQCRHVVCANSSFSWWGGWLNDRQGKIVIAPKQWFAAAENDSTDIVPRSWLRVGGIQTSTLGDG